MKRISALLIFILTAYFSFTQVIFSDIIEGNSVKGYVNTNGLFFNNPISNFEGYEFPKGSGNQLMSFSNFWFGGVDSTDALFLAAYNIL